MAKNNGYMIVRYSRYRMPDEEIDGEDKAPGRRLSTYPNYKVAKIFFKQYVEEIESNSTWFVQKKDIRKGFIQYGNIYGKLLLALMPYSDKHIEDIII